MGVLRKYVKKMSEKDTNSQNNDDESIEQKHSLPPLSHSIKQEHPIPNDTYKNLFN